MDKKKIAEEVSYEAALFGIMKLIADKSNNIEISEHTIFVPEEKNEVFEKLSFLIGFITNSDLHATFDDERAGNVIDFGNFSKELSFFNDMK